MLIKKTLKQLLSILLGKNSLGKVIFFLKRARHTIRRINPFISVKYLYTGNSSYFNIYKLRNEIIQTNLIILGAHRSGTTSLHHYLNNHPNIFMSYPVKEPCFFLPVNFINKRRFSQGFKYSHHTDLQKNCMLQGYTGQKVIGESSTFYTMAENSRTYDIPNKMKEINPLMKFIYIIRNPFSRIISHYLQVQKIDAPEDLNKFIKNDYFIYPNTRYYYQITEYLKHFSTDQFKIVIFEDMVQQKETVLKNIYKFLDLEPLDIFKDSEIYNKSENQKNYAVEELKFSNEVFDKLMLHLTPEIENIQKAFNLSLDLWDLTREKWMK